MKFVSYLLTICALLALPPGALAADPAPSAHPADAATPENEPDAYPHIPPGRERQVVKLLAPYAPGGPIAESWAIGDVALSGDAIRIALTGPAGATAALVLEHPGRAPSAPWSTPSFAATLASPAPPEPPLARAAAALLAAITANDTGAFWPPVAPRPPPPAEPASTAPPPPEPAPAAGAIPTTPPPPLTLESLATDGLLLALLALALLLAVTTRALRDAPRRATWALLAIVLVGAALRLALAPDAPMTAWPMRRLVPLARSAWEGPLLAALSRALDLTIPLDRLNHLTTLALAVLTPVALFAHARHLLGAVTPALAAAALIALLPHHIRFSFSDAWFIQSVALASLAFALLYAALSDPSARWRALFTLAFAPVCLATFYTRPLNILFVPIFLGAVFFTSPREVPRPRRAALTVLVAAASALALKTFLLARFGNEVREGLSLHTLRGALSLLTDTQRNTLINPAMTSPLLLLLAALGTYALWRDGLRRKALFLWIWLVLFFVGHGFVISFSPVMQSRYNLHLITPFLLLAAAATPRALAFPRAARLALATLLLTMPLVHLAYVRDVDFNLMRESAFVRAQAAALPDGCTVLETAPARHGDASELFWARSADLMRAGIRTRRFAVATVLIPDGQPLDAPATALAPLAAALQKPNACAVFYEGLACWAERGTGQSPAPACRGIHDALALTAVASTAFESRVYEPPFAPATRWAEHELITLTLWRVDGFRQSQATD
ncbi:MAG: hypothetical protein R3F39_21395 [Myxococcota bacterium]